MSYCTVGCRAAGVEIAGAHRLLDTLGASEPVDAYLEAAERLAAAWAAVQDHRYRLRRHALDCGLTPRQFAALLRGHVAADPYPSADAG